MPGEFHGNPHPALLAVLLMMLQSGQEVEKSLDDLANFMQSTKSALGAMRSGVEAFHAGMLKMAPAPHQGRPPSGPPKPKGPITQPAAPPDKDTVMLSPPVAVDNKPAAQQNSN